MKALAWGILGVDVRVVGALKCKLLVGELQVFRLSFVNLCIT